MKTKALNREDIYHLEFHEFLIDYLKEMFPIKRVKHRKKFSRAIVVKNETLFLSYTPPQTIYNKLTTELYNIIGANPEILADAVFDYLY